MNWLSKYFPVTLGLAGGLFFSGDDNPRSALTDVADHGFVAMSIDDLKSSEVSLIEEHCPFGLPDEDNILVRPGYISSYLPRYRIPEWVGYHVVKDYLNTPTREGEFKKFRTDEQIPNAVRSSEYTNSGYARGHLAPYGVMGGDRNSANGNARNGDQFDFETVFQANYMSNVAPQWHDGFNGNSGLWYNLERWVQSTLVDKNNLEVWVTAGCVFATDFPKDIGKSESRPLGVPEMFYKLVTVRSGDGYETLCFLFPHKSRKNDNLTRYLVSIDYVETLTGLDFFRHLESHDEDYEMQSSRIRFDKHFARFGTRYLHP